ncbi:MAG TPA: hypothetical protein ENJ08_10905, partial [Gammaproteobacteria bacterium]|nr:hypothetical protein [Gammaproteobacteria bacterium]
MMNKSNYKIVGHLALISLLIMLAGCQEDPSDNTGPGTNEECSSTSGPGCLSVATSDSCIDADGDGYGVGCNPGADCDDTNINVWESCTIAGPGKFVFGRSTYSVQESQSILEIEVNRVQGTTGAVSVTYTTDRLGQGVNPFAQDNDFSQPGDYDGIFNTLNFADGEASQTFTVTIYDDSSDEGDETFGLKLLDPSGGAQLAASSSATVTIVDDDKSTPAPVTPVPVTPAPVTPAPDGGPLSITSTGGTLARGKTFTINGSGFGTKSPAAPLAWETFDNGVNNTRLSTDPNWPAYRQGGARYSNVSPHSGGLSAYNRVEYDSTSSAASSPFGFATNNYFFPKSDEIYYSYVYRQEGTSVGPAVQKLGRINSTGNLYNGLGVLALSDSYVLYQPGNNIEYPSDDNGSGRFFDTALLGRNTWTRHQLYGKLSQPAGAKNGLVWVSVGESLKTFANVVTRDQGETFQYDSVILGLMFANTNWETGAVHDMYIDDVYIDNTLARVELCEGSTWATRGVCNPQPPTKWSNSSVQVTVNPGEWSAGTIAYLYVVNADGDAGAKGYQVLVSNEECSSTSGPGCLPVTEPDSCIDADGDGYGVSCNPGADCDDTDINVWENCAIAEPGKFVFGRSTYSVQESQSILEIEVNRVQGTTGAVSVTYTTDRLGQGVNPFAQDNDF